MLKFLIRDRRADRHFVAQLPRAARIRHAYRAWCRGESPRQAYLRARVFQKTIRTVTWSRQLYHTLRGATTRANRARYAIENQPARWRARSSRWSLRGAPSAPKQSPTSGSNAGLEFPRSNVWPDRQGRVASPVVDKLSKFAYTCQPRHPINAIIKEANL